MKLLYFKLVEDFGDDMQIISNNEADLENHLIKGGFKNIEFSDLRENYGRCYLGRSSERLNAECHYITKV